MDLAKLVVPIALFIAVAYGFRILVTAVLRIVALRQGGSEELIRSMQEGERETRRQSSLMWGLNLVALAIAFAVIEALRLYSVTPGTIAIGLGALGIANLVYYALIRRLR